MQERFENELLARERDIALNGSPTGKAWIGFF